MSACECQKPQKDKKKDKFCGKKHNKNIVGIVSGDSSLTTLVPPVVVPLQVIPVQKHFFDLDPQIYVMFNTVNYVSRECLWNPRLYAFQIKECGTYNLSYHLAIFFAPDSSAPIQVYPDTLGAAISIYDCQNQPKKLIGTTFESGQPLSFEVDGALGILTPLQSSTIENLEAGDFVRIQVKAVKNNGLPVTGKVLILGSIQFPILPLGTNNLIQDTRFTIEKC